MNRFPFLTRRARRIQQAFRQLEKYPLPPEEIDGLSQLSEKAPPRELYKSNPAFLAQRLGLPLAQTLDLLTLAAAENLWKLEWDARCPACSSLLQSAANLGQLKSEQTCPNCGWNGEIHLDREITLQASLDEQVRNLADSQRDDPAFRQEQDERLGRTSALVLVNRPLFRELMGEQTLPDNHSLGVQHLAVFFSDLKSSTAMYQRLGDAEAYQLVREHFAVIFKAVEKNGGSGVKTIGDGVMGTFFDSASALRGISDIAQGLAQLNRLAGLRRRERLRLKVGLHAGPCIVVTLNRRLDYFGTTVNIASRLSTLAEGDDLLLCQSVLLEPEAVEVIRSLGDLEPESVSLRGITEPLQAYRLRFTLY